MFIPSKKLALFVFIFLTINESFAVNVQQFSKSNSLTFKMIEDARISSSHVVNHYKILYNLGISYVDHPLVIKNSQNTELLDDVIDAMTSIHLGAAYSITPDWKFAFTTSYSFFEDNFGNKTHDFQDIDLKMKYRLYDGRRDAFTLMPIVTVPLDGGKTFIQDNATPPKTYGTDYLLSDRGVGVGLFLLYEHLFRTFQLSFNLGYKYNDKAKFVDETGTTQIDKTQVLTTGVGLYYPFHKKVGLNIEYISNFTAPFFNDDINPNEIFFGLSGGLSKTIHIFTGAGFGNLFESSDGNDFRLTLGIKFHPGTSSGKDYKSKRKHKPNRIIKDNRLFCEGAYLFDNANSIVLLFKNDSDQISSQQIEKLSEALTTYKERQNDITSIEILGHTSRSASYEYNMDLGKRRANKIKAVLAENGIDFNKVNNVKSFGESSLLDSSNTIEAEEVNRRVEVNFIIDKKFEDCYE